MELHNTIDILSIYTKYSLGFGGTLSTKIYAPRYRNCTTRFWFRCVFYATRVWRVNHHPQVVWGYADGVNLYKYEIEVADSLFVLE